MANNFRELYNEDVDFSLLAQQDEDFQKHLKHNGQLDFSNPASVQQLTKSLLKRDFDLIVELPDDRLCPPVPNRLNFLLWIQDLLDSAGPRLDGCPDPERTVTALDVGTGASCIFPLLACRTSPRWRVVATDVDTKNLEYAQRNVHRNGLESRVRMWASTLDGPLIPLEKIGMEHVDIVFTNPPFYPSASALEASAGLKARPPASACTGTAVEMVTAGGEVGFARRLALESKTLGPARVSWCATMLGQRASVEHVVEGLRALGCGNWAVGELVQGRRTRRWAVAWSWGGRRPNTATARGIPSLPKHLLPFPSSFFIALPNGTAADASGVGNRVDTAMQSLEMRWRYRADWMEGVGFAAENVWSRAARRKKEGKTQRTGPESSRMDEDEESEEEDPALGVRIRVQEAAAPSDKEENTSGTHGVMSWQVEVRWLLGIDSVVFESFCGWLKRIVDR